MQKCVFYLSLSNIPSLKVQFRTLVSETEAVECSETHHNTLLCIYIYILHITKSRSVTNAVQILRLFFFFKTPKMPKKIKAVQQQLCQLQLSVKNILFKCLEEVNEEDTR